MYFSIIMHRDHQKLLFLICFYFSIWKYLSYTWELKTSFSQNVNTAYVELTILSCDDKPLRRPTLLRSQAARVVFHCSAGPQPRSNSWTANMTLPGKPTTVVPEEFISQCLFNIYLSRLSRKNLKQAETWISKNKLHDKTTFFLVLFVFAVANYNHQIV